MLCGKPREIGGTPGVSQDNTEELIRCQKESPLRLELQTMELLS